MAINYKKYKEANVSLVHELKLLGLAHQIGNIGLHIYRDLALYMMRFGKDVDSSMHYTSDKNGKSERISFQTEEGIFVRINSMFQLDKGKKSYVPVNCITVLSSFGSDLEPLKKDLENRIIESCQKYMHLSTLRN